MCVGHNYVGHAYVGNIYIGPNNVGHTYIIQAITEALGQKDRVCAPARARVCVCWHLCDYVC